MTTKHIISDARKAQLRKMSVGCDIKKLKDEIALREKNKILFLKAIEKEDITITEYEYMIMIREIQTSQ